MVDITVDGDERVALDLAGQPAHVERAGVRAMNRAIEAARTVMAREISKDLQLRVGVVREALRMQQASIARPEASLSGSRLKRIPVIDMGATGPFPSRGRGRGVSWRNQGRKRDPKAFIAVMKSGHKGVFKRVSKKRLGIIELRGPSLGHVFEKFKPVGMARLLEVFTQRFKHEYQFKGSGAGDAAE
ncbi:MAG: phage tail protein [Vicinamibacterales bacterium]|nr:phage tail protein [Vicinamibacterales bacterium]